MSYSSYSLIPSKPGGDGKEGMNLLMQSKNNKFNVSVTLQRPKLSRVQQKCVSEVNLALLRLNYPFSVNNFKYFSSNLDKFIKNFETGDWDGK